MLSIGFDYDDSRKFIEYAGILKFYKTGKEWKWKQNIRITLGDLSKDKKLPASMFSFVLAILHFSKLTKKRVGIIATR